MPRPRRATRITLSARVEGLAQYWSDIRVLDVSATGALLECPRFLETGSRLTLEFSIANFPLSLRAEVMHCSKPESDRYRAGVRFEGLSPEMRDRVQVLIQSILRQERRVQPRIYLGQEAQLAKEIELSVINLSLLGGLFSVQHALEFDSEHDFVFVLPGGEVRARGVVRHCEAWAKARDAAIFRVGVEFTELTGDDRERVVAYLETESESSS